MPSNTKTIYHYRLYCIDEAKTVMVWDSVPPTVCPNNASHSIDTNSITIIKQVSNNETIIAQDSFKTGNNYQFYSFDVTANANTTGSYSISYPYTIALLNGYTDINPSEQKGDVLNGIVNTDMVVGALTANAADTDTELKVSGTVIQNAFVGQYISLTDGVNTSDYSKINSIGDTTITLETAVGFNFNAATPTYVRQRTYVIRNIVISSNTTRIGIDRGKIGGGILDVGRTLTLYYSNNGDTTKTITFYLEILY